MLDSVVLTRIEDWFKSYVARFRLQGVGATAIQLKIDHSHRVRHEMAALCTSLAIENERRVIAEITALLHDVGRFEQFKRHGTYTDSRSEDHAVLGVSVLRTEGPLTLLGPAAERLVLAAVAVHNKRKIPDGLDEDSRQLAAMTRDADKLDIMKIALWSYGKKDYVGKSVIELDLPETPGFSDVVAANLRGGSTVRMEMVRNINDFKLLQMGYTRDLNFPWTCRQFIERGYLDDLRRHLPPSPEIDGLYAAAVAHAASRAIGCGKTIMALNTAIENKGN